jgi:hypothetical protein
MVASAEIDREYLQYLKASVAPNSKQAKAVYQKLISSNTDMSSFCMITALF